MSRKNGACVRLQQGDMARATVFNRDPAQQAHAFETQGFRHLHVVDLDGAFAGKPMPNRGMIFWEHEGNCAVRDGKWKLVSRFPDTWELYVMEADRTETNDLVDAEPGQVERLAAAYEAWAKRVGAQPWPMPQTPPGARTGALPMPDYLRVDRPVGSLVHSET